MNSQEKAIQQQSGRWSLRGIFNQWPLLLVLTLNLLAVMGAQAHAGHDSRLVHPFIVSGVIVNSNTASRVEEFARTLGKAAGYPLQVQFVDSYSLLSAALHKDPNAIGWTCGAPYVEDHVRDGQQLVGIPLFRGEPTYYSVIIARKGRPEKTLLDFKGKVLAYSDPRSNSGYVAPAYQLKQAGFDIRDYFRLLLHAGNHERSIEAVASGLADVAAVDEYVWVEYLKSHPDLASKVVEIDRLGPFPFTPIVAGSAVSQKTIDRLQKVLIELPNKPEGKKLLNGFGLDGFTVRSDDFYQPIKKMMRDLNWPQESAR